MPTRQVLEINVLLRTIRRVAILLLIAYSGCSESPRDPSSFSASSIEWGKVIEGPTLFNDLFPSIELKIVHTKSGDAENRVDTLDFSFLSSHDASIGLPISTCFEDHILLLDINGNEIIRRSSAPINECPTQTISIKGGEAASWREVIPTGKIYQVEQNQEVRLFLIYDLRLLGDKEGEMRKKLPDDFEGNWILFVLPESIVASDVLEISR